MNRPFAWEKSYPPGVSWDAPIEVSTVSALLDEGLARSADRAVFDFRDRAISYRELAGKVDRLAAAFLARGIGPGSAVGAVPAEHALPPDRVLRLHEGRHPGGPHERARGRARARPQAQGFAAPACSSRRIGRRFCRKPRSSRRAGSSTSSSSATTPIGGRGRSRSRRCGAATASRRSPTSSAMPAARFAAPRVAVDDVALLQYTGGTTGLPKGAMLTHAQPHGGGVELRRLVCRPGPAASCDDKVLLVLPLFHIYALTTILLRQVKHGNEMLLRDAVRRRGDPRATSRSGAPPPSRACRRCGSRSRTIPASRAATCPRCASAAPAARRCRSRSAARFERLTGQQLGGGWGMTETAPAGTNLPLDGPAQARLDRRAAARHRDGHRLARRPPPGARRRTRRARSRSGPERHRRATGTGPRRRRRPSSTAGSSPATSATWTRTATSSSSTARRT